MSVLFQYSAGTFVVDFNLEDCPENAKNVIKLCKMKRYNNCLLFNVQKSFLVQFGDRTGTGKGGRSALGCLKKEKIYVDDEIPVHSKMNKKGLVCMANEGKENSNTSQLFITLRGSDLGYLEGRHTVVGEVVEGLEELEKLCNETFVDESFR